MKTASLPLCQNYSITRYMGRVHVATPPLEVARKIRREYPDGGLPRFLELDRTRRRFALACALNAHAENRQEYRLVMNGVERPLEWTYRFDKAGQTPRETVRIPS
jgi:hypothetical protein